MSENKPPETPETPQPEGEPQRLTPEQEELKNKIQMLIASVQAQTLVVINAQRTDNDEEVKVLAAALPIMDESGTGQPQMTFVPIAELITGDPNQKYRTAAPGGGYMPAPGELTGPDGRHIKSQSKIIEVPGGKR